MKKVLIALIIFHTGFVSQAQTLYGTTFYGGANGGGTINKFEPSPNILTVVNSFEAYPENPNFNNFIQAADGKLYSMTSGGGAYGYGVIFSFDPVSSDYTKLKDFDNTAGAYPLGSLVLAGDGKLYGMTSAGGTNNLGVIFSFDPVSSTYIKLKDLDNSSGSAPNGSFIQATDGKLYGMASTGGSSNLGVIFSFNPVSMGYTILKDFTSADGSTPFGSLIQAGDGKLYGMTSSGGSLGFGVIFSIDPLSSVYTRLKNFDFTNGGNPHGALVQATDGKFYGFTVAGGSSSGGVIFSFIPATLSYTKLKDLDNSSGSTPSGNIIQASDGKLYGITSNGGTNGAGVLFSYSIPGAAYTDITNFSEVAGRPAGSLMQATNGKFYAMGNNKYSESGVIFSFDPISSVYTELKDLGVNTGGSNPPAGLRQATNGKLYGVTANGGAHGVGVLFSFDPSSSSYIKLKDFDLVDGASPYGDLLQANNGKLYGLASLGGSNGFGVMYSFDPSTATYTKLLDFGNGSGNVGAQPIGGLMQASNGKLYGMTEFGGILGVLFSYDIASSVYTELMTFNNTDGAFPNGDLIQATNGKLYGMTGNGGPNNVGVIFSFDPSANIYSQLYNFDNPGGSGPRGSFVQATNGKLYATTGSGGNNNAGVIFSFDPLTFAYSKLYDFNTANGAHPSGTLVQASDGKLYGFTASGGVNNAGVVFSFDLLTSTYVKLKDLDGSNGSAARSGFIELKPCTTLSTYYKDNDGDGYGNPAITIQACIQPPGYVTNNTDCDDNNPGIHSPVTYYRDADGDGFGDPNHSVSVCSCIPPRGYVSNNYDCNDNPKKHKPDEVIMCNGKKQMCVERKEIKKRIQRGWHLGPCDDTCGTGEILMCREGKQKCVPSKEVELLLHLGWKIGNCKSGPCNL